MTSVPARPRIYHITHVENLPSIVRTGGLQSDSMMIGQGGPPASVGMSNIKERRLRLPVKCHSGDRVGDYVPFYFCPRSIMLYLIHTANHPELAYRGGQSPILHLESDLYRTLDWADSLGRRWAFSLSNAASSYAEFRNRRSELDEIDWVAVAATDFRDPAVQEGKQAEFLIHEFFPWDLVEGIGVISQAIRNQVEGMLSGAPHRPKVEVRPEWYY